MKFIDSFRFTHPPLQCLFPGSFLLLIGIFCVSETLFPHLIMGAEIEECKELLRSGKYQECITETANAIKAYRYGEVWHVVKAEAELKTGQYQEAATTIETALKRYSASVQLRLLGYHALLHLNKQKAAEEYLKAIDKAASDTPWRYTSTDDLLALGKAALIVGADAKHVLEGFYDRARKRDPDRREPILSFGELALEKNDVALAAELFQQGVQKFPHDADIQFGLARAVASSSPERSLVALQKTMKLNPNHISALLFRIDRLIRQDEFETAEQLIQHILKINAVEPKAWAYRSVIAHLKGESKAEQQAYDKAMSTWSKNPEVEHLIGLKLSQHYRFQEGSQHQLRALEFQPTYLPAKRQLSQDYLRLGKEQEGWKLAEEVHAKDGYHVTIYNLLELKDQLDEFETIENADFILRMTKWEAEIYGPQVMELLQQAKQTLCQKYHLELKDPVIVELFDDENDFAVRTFGMPVHSGYLGVCFGKVITANSPASQQEHPSNWKSVLWHEFCHVVTLHLTNNRIPRWLSEGISVYEESQQDASWGQRMNALYRERILNRKLTPISSLSKAFMSPDSPFDMQFAYYQSSMVVEHLVEEHGFEVLLNILEDVGAGLPVNTALERHTEGLVKLESSFQSFAEQKAKSLAPQADWEKPDLDALVNDDGNALELWLKDHPKNIYGLTAYALKLIQDEKWEEAKTPLHTLRKLHPTDISSQNASLMLARVHRELKETDLEEKILSDYVKQDASHLPSRVRLLDYHRTQQDWKTVIKIAHQILSINPLMSSCWEALSQAAEATNNSALAIESYQRLLHLNPADPAHIHFRLASAFQNRNHKQARDHVLLALEAAPRYREAHQLLLRLHRSTPMRIPLRAMRPNQTVLSPDSVRQSP